jgi:predicted PurR-regulated permease PerM
MAADDRSAQQRHAAAAWADLRDRLRTVTPQAIGRAGIVLVALAGGAWLTQATWPALLPFIVGGLITYQLLPVVDALDRVMPRFLAALISVVAVVAVIVGVALLILPPLANVFVRFATDLPTAADVDRAVGDLEKQLGSLPDGSAAVVIPVLTALTTAFRDFVGGAAGNLDDIVRASVAALLNTIGALLGLIVLPTWMLVVMNDKERARTAIDRRIASGFRRDAWALVAIADRAAGAYLRGYVVTAGIVALLAYVGLRISPQVGGPTFQEPLALAAFAGIAQVVPIIGTIIGLLPAALLLPLAPDRAAAYLAVYIGARIIGSSLVGNRIMGRRLGVHPAILVPAVVMIGQFGVLWLLLAAPIVAIVVDVIRYLHGRLSEPPRPAGVLPHEMAGTLMTNAPVPRTPAVYRQPRAPQPIPLTATPATPVAQP